MFTLHSACPLHVLSTDVSFNAIMWMFRWPVIVCKSICSWLQKIHWCRFRRLWKQEAEVWRLMSRSGQSAAHCIKNVRVCYICIYMNISKETKVLFCSVILAALVDTVVMVAALMASPSWCTTTPSSGPPTSTRFSPIEPATRLPCSPGLNWRAWTPGPGSSQWVFYFVEFVKVCSVVVVVSAVYSIATEEVIKFFSPRAEQEGWNIHPWINQFVDWQKINLQF